jgi:SH3-like domain-containing protein
MFIRPGSEDKPFSKGIEMAYFFLRKNSRRRSAKFRHDGQRLKMAGKAAIIWTALALGISGAIMATPVRASTQATSKGASGLPLPRFASIKATRMNMRVGPGTEYAAAWLYTRPGLPVEIIAEFENWRRIRDADGTEGWVYHSMLSGRRTAVAAPWMEKKGDKIFVNMRDAANKEAPVIAKLQPGVVMTLDECNGNWCKAETDGTDGWVSQAEIWGAYPGEAFK